MDLICIKRRYKKVRRIVILSFIIILFIYTFLVVNHVQAERRKKIIFAEDLRTIKQAMQEEKIRAQEEIKAKPKPKILTTDEVQRLKNIYKTDEKIVFLTFDDGPSKTVTVPILDLLKQENIKANFFVLGSRVDLYPNIVKRAYEEGHYIGNHGYSHQYPKIYESSNSVLEEYNKTNQSVRNAIGNSIYNTNIFRFPGGSVGGIYHDLKSEAKLLLEQNNIASVDWNALNGDSEGLRTEEDMVNRLKETIEGKNSVVILMHDAGDKVKTYNALPRIIEYLKQEGYEFKTFYDILENEIK